MSTAHRSTASRSCTRLVPKAPHTPHGIIAAYRSCAGDDPQSKPLIFANSWENLGDSFLDTTGPQATDPHARSPWIIIFISFFSASFIILFLPVGLLESVAAQVIQELAAVLEASLRRGRLRWDPKTVLQEHTCQAAALGGALVALTVEFGPHHAGALGEGAAVLPLQPLENRTPLLVSQNASQTVEDRRANRIGRRGFEEKGPTRTAASYS
jgi:hypothetical protein